ncbi:hypothetical protein J2W42_006532 [Rhizobium tibeticum]|nr:hypothetical protein [Rhizobium tibeticum]
MKPAGSARSHRRLLDLLSLPQEPQGPLVKIPSFRSKGQRPRGAREQTDAKMLFQALNALADRRWRERERAGRRRVASERGRTCEGDYPRQPFNSDLFHHGMSKAKCGLIIKAGFLI